jgi:glucose/mannose-6-phosphate isomerase
MTKKHEPQIKNLGVGILISQKRQSCILDDMKESILQFKKQLSYEPEVVHENLLGKFKHVILCGMGGSHLQAGILKMYKPGIDLYVHRNYNLPPYDKEFFENALIIISSYSGNTEEVLSSLEIALIRKYRVAVITSGGELLEKAREHRLPHVVLPSTGIQPRAALGYSTLALAKLMGETHYIADMKDLKFTLHPESLESHGKTIAEALKGKIPVIYSSTRNLELAYIWKIKMNETGKVPAFYNIFPELNHNEMQGFGNGMGNELLHGIFLKDKEDYISIQKRMDITESQYEAQGYGVTALALTGEDRLHTIFSSVLLADWVSLAIAEAQGVDAEQVPAIEEFKKQLDK